MLDVQPSPAEPSDKVSPNHPTVVKHETPQEGTSHLVVVEAGQPQNFER